MRSRYLVKYTRFIARFSCSEYTIYLTFPSESPMGYDLRSASHRPENTAGKPWNLEWGLADHRSLCLSICFPEKALIFPLGPLCATTAPGLVPRRPKAAEYVDTNQ